MQRRMTLAVLGLCAVVGWAWLAETDARAVPISLFSDLDTYLDRAKEIVIARCLEAPEDVGISYIDGLYPATTEVVATLKGKRNLGDLKIATIYPMRPGRTYLLTNTGGNAFNTDFLSLGQMTVVPVPDGFDLKSLQGKSLKEQVQRVFARNLYEVERELEPLLAQEKMLREALKDRRDDLFESKGPIQLSESTEIETKKEGSGVFLEMPCGRLEWSHSRPGQSGYFYFNITTPDQPQWEFAALDRDINDLKALDGKPLNAKFFGAFSPSRDKLLGQASGNAIYVEVGQLLLARSASEPKTIYVLEIVSQGTSEAMRCRYAVVRAN